MFRLAPILGKYFFVGFLVYFLAQGVLYILNERGIFKTSGRAAVFKQRAAIILFHTCCFLLLSYESGGFSRDVLLTGFAGLLFLFSAMLVSSFFYENSCPLIWNGLFFLLALGLAMQQRLATSGGGAQLFFYNVGMTCALIIPLALKVIPKFEKLSFVYMLTGLALLLLPFFIGRSAYGATNWVRVGFISFQPSEAVKFLFVIYLASAYRNEVKLKNLVFPGVMSGIFVLILVLQNDLGGALIFFMSFMVLTYIAYGSELLFLAGMLAASGGAIAAYRFLSHIQTRVSAWLNPWEDPYNRGYQILQSLFAIGTWGFLGSGLTRGYPGYVPNVVNDMIFAAICEEFGGVFGVLIIGIYIMIFYRGTHIALRSHNRYFALLAAGFTGLLAFQTFLILGGVIKLIPLTGVTLPFVSAGGSSAVSCIIMIGFTQWIGLKPGKARSNGI